MNDQRIALNISQAAQLIGVDRKTMAALVHRGECPAFRAGKRWVIPRSGLEAWITEAAGSGAVYGGVHG